MSDLNKCILLVMKLLDDPESVSKDELVESRRNALANAAANAAVYVAVYASAFDAEKWVNKYFERTDENKQDYIKAIEAEKKLQGPESKEWEPKVGETCLVEYPYDDGCFKPFHGKKVTILGSCSDGDGESVFTAHGADGFIALYAVGFRPLKTQEQKDREAFIEAGIISYDNCEAKLFVDYVKLLLGKMFDDGFKEPEGE